VKIKCETRFELPIPQPRTIIWDVREFKKMEEVGQKESKFGRMVNSAKLPELPCPEFDIGVTVSHRNHPLSLRPYKGRKLGHYKATKFKSLVKA